MVAKGNNSRNKIRYILHKGINTGDDSLWYPAVRSKAVLYQTGLFRLGLFRAALF